MEELIAMLTNGLGQIGLWWKEITATALLLYILHAIARGTLAQVSRIIIEKTAALVKKKFFPDPDMGMKGIRPTTLMKTTKDPGIFKKLHYSSRSFAFVGRAEEEALLQEFCLKPSPFLWWAITGEGGMGKSRLALEQALSLEGNGWHTMFLGSADQLKDNLAILAKGEHSPAKFTLLIVDYAAFHEQELAAAILGCSKAAAGWKHKLRILILDRNLRDIWYAKLDRHASFGDLSEITDCRYKEPLVLGELSGEDILVVAREVLQDSIIPEDWKERLMRDRRPLYALLLALADEHGGKSVEDVIRALIRREEARWAETCEGFVDADKTLLRIATANGEINLETRASLPDVLTSFFVEAGYFTDKERFMRKWKGISLEGQLRLRGIEPDLLGELFFLDSVNLPENILDKCNARAHWCREFASLWQYDCNSFISFVARVLRDYRSHPRANVLLDTVNASCPDTPECKIMLAGLYKCLAFYYCDVADTAKARKMYETIRAIATEYYPENLKLLIQLGRVAEFLFDAYRETEEIDAAKALYGDFVALVASAPPDELLQSIHGILTAGIIEIYGMEGDNATARRLHDDYDQKIAGYEREKRASLLEMPMFALVAAYSSVGDHRAARPVYDSWLELIADDPQKEEWLVTRIMSAANLISAYGKEELAEARKMYDTVNDLFDRSLTDKTKDLSWCHIGFMISAYVDSGDIEAARKLYIDLSVLAAAQPENKQSLARADAAARLNYAYIEAGYFAAAQEMYEELKTLGFSLFQAYAATRFVYLYAESGDLVAARRLYDDIAPLVAANPDNKKLALQQAAMIDKLVVTFIDAGDVEAAQGLYEDCSALTATFPRSEKLAVMQASAAGNLSSARADSGDREAARRLYESIAIVAGVCPRSEKLAEIQVETAKRLIVAHAVAGDLDEAERLYKNVATLTTAFPESETLAESQALVIDYLVCTYADAGDREATERLHADIAALSAAHPESERFAVFYAKTVTRVSFAYEDAGEWDAVARLYEELVALAAAHPGSEALAVFQAEVASSLVYHHVDAGNREATGRTYDDMTSLLVAHPCSEELAAAQANVVGNLILANARAGEHETALQIFRDFVRLIGARVQSGELVKEPVDVLAFLAHCCAQEGNSSLVRQIYDELAALSAKCPENEELALTLAMLAQPVIFAFGKWGKLEDARSFYKDFISAIGDYRQNEQMALAYAKAADMVVPVCHLLEKVGETELIYDELAALCHRFPGNDKLAELLADTAGKLVAFYLQVGNYDGARHVYDRFVNMTYIVKTSSTFTKKHCRMAQSLIDECMRRADFVEEVRMRATLIPPVPFMQACLRDGNLSVARQAYEGLARMANERPDSFDFTSAQADAAVGLIQALVSAGDFDAAQQIYDDALLSVNRAEAEDRYYWMRGRVGPALVLAYVQAGKSEAGWQIFDNLVSDSKGEAEDEKYALDLGSVAVELIKELGEVGEIETAARVYDTLAVLAADHPENGGLIRTCGSMAVALINVCLEVGEIGEATQMYNNLETLAASFPETEGLLWEFGNAAHIMTQEYCKRSYLEAAVQVYEGLAATVGDCLGEDSLAFFQANMAIALLEVFTAAGDRGMARRLTDDVASFVSRDIGGDTMKLIRSIAMAIIINDHIEKGEKEKAIEVYQGISVLADTHEGNQEFAMTRSGIAFLLIEALTGTGDLVTAREIFEDIATIYAARDNGIERAAPEGAGTLINAYVQVGDLGAAREIYDYVTTANAGATVDKKTVREQAEMAYILIDAYRKRGQMDEAWKLHKALTGLRPRSKALLNRIETIRKELAASQR